MSEEAELTPTVLWAQRQRMVIITVKYEPSEVRTYTAKLFRIVRAEEMRGAWLTTGPHYIAS